MSRPTLYLPAMQGRFGDWTYYAALMRLADLQERVGYAREIHHNPRLSEMIQRRLDDARRATDIADYLVQTNDRFFNSLVVGVHGGHPQWHPFEVSTRNEEHAISDVDEVYRDALGYLEFTGREMLFALDGQHRLAGIRQALERSEGLGNDRVSVLFVSHAGSVAGLRRTRSLFVAINKKAVPVAKRDIIALDEVDLAATLTRRLVDDEALFARGQIDVDRFTPSIAATAPSLTTIGNFYDIVKIVVADVVGRDHKDELSHGSRVRLSDDRIDFYFQQVRSFLLRLLRVDSRLFAAMRSTNFGPSIVAGRTLPEARLMFRPIGLTIVTRLVAALRRDRTLDDAFELAGRIPLDLTAAPFVDVIWDTRRNRMVTANATVAQALLLYMLGARAADGALRDRYAAARGIPAEACPPASAARPRVNSPKPPPLGTNPGTGPRTAELATVFRATSSSYKFYWFLALLDALPYLDGPIPVMRLVRTMVIRAWSTVARYRLSLGRTDRLQQCVLDLQAHAGLGSTETQSRLEAALDAWSQLPRWSEELARFVPGRFLGAWFPEVAQTRPYDRRGARDVAAAAYRAWGSPAEGPYRLFDQNGRQMIEVAPAWRDWLSGNEVLSRGYAEHCLCRYLQARNPGVPGIVHKLEVPGRRALTVPRRWWRDLLGRGSVFAVDLYTGGALDAGFDLDHFLPWTFVAHDEPWNLAPTIAAVNRSKGDRLPDLDAFLPRLARLHSEALAVPEMPPALARSYSEFLRTEVGGARRLSDDEVLGRYRDVVQPLAQIASNQGFVGGWRPGP